MLTKLIGYEMKAFGRIILPLYAATIGMSFLIGLGVRFLPEEMYSNWFGGILLSIFIVLIIATMVMTGVLCVQRFYQNLLGNEGYLMFSLPAGTHELILSKVIGSLIWSILGGVAAMATVAAMGLAAVSLPEIARGLREFVELFDPQVFARGMGSAAVWTVISILSFAAALMQIYTALAIGHQWSSHRILGSVLAYFGIDVVKNIVSGILANIGIHIGLFGMLIENGPSDGAFPAKLQVTMAGSAVVLIFIYSMITWYLLDRKLNLE